MKNTTMIMTIIAEAIEAILEITKDYVVVREDFDDQDAPMIHLAVDPEKFDIYNEEENHVFLEMDFCGKEIGLAMDITAGEEEYEAEIHISDDGTVDSDTDRWWNDEDDDDDEPVSRVEGPDEKKAHQVLDDIQKVVEDMVNRLKAVEGQK